LRRRTVFRWIGFAFLGLVVLSAAGLLVLWLTLPDVGWLKAKNPDTTAFIELRKREGGKGFKLRWTWRPLSRISPLLRRAVVHAEDGRFFQHEGVDWEAVKKTAEQNWQEKSLHRGGSTITQQLAKNLFLSPSRNPIRKLRELLISWRLEDSLSKDRILELYLNIAEWGPGVFGAEAAARHWYGVSAAELSAAQAARLAVALPNPHTRSPRARSKMLDRKAARLVRALQRGGLLSDEELRAALSALHQPVSPEAPPPTAEETEAEPEPEPPKEPEPAPEPPDSADEIPDGP
jgi:monofunctional biosynthetic peptidoglycan transglycosylase